MKDFQTRFCIALVKRAEEERLEWTEVCWWWCGVFLVVVFEVVNNVFLQ